MPQYGLTPDEHGCWYHALAGLKTRIAAQWLARGSRRDRVAAKFVENEFEKVDRLMELYGRYGARVVAEERRLGTSDESYDDEEVLLARMDAGLYTLQQVRACVGSVPGASIGDLPDAWPCLVTLSVCWFAQIWLHSKTRCPQTPQDANKCHRTFHTLATGSPHHRQPVVRRRHGHPQARADAAAPEERDAGGGQGRPEGAPAQHRRRG